MYYQEKTQDIIFYNIEHHIPMSKFLSPRSMTYGILGGEGGRGSVHEDRAQREDGGGMSWMGLYFPCRSPESEEVP